MRRWAAMAAGAAFFGGLALAGCGADDGTPPAVTDTGETPAVSASPTTEVSPPQPTTAPPTRSAPIDPAALASVKADVETVAVSLESFYRGTPYPETTVEVIDTLADAGLRLSEGNRIAGYVYDPAAVEFRLCVEHDSGAWATYDTAPMTLRENGVRGGCPFS